MVAAPKLNPASPLNDGLLAWYLGHPSYFGGTVWPDLKREEEAASFVSMGDDAWTTSKPTGGFGSLHAMVDEGDYLALPTVTIAGGSDFTMAVWVNIDSYPVGAPGFWRSGQTFMAFQGSNGRPWIRWGGVEVLRVSSPGVPTGQWVYLVYTVTSGAVASVYLDAGLLVSRPHSVVTPAVSFSAFGWQNIPAERVPGFYSDLRFYSRALSPTEIAAYYAESLGGYKSVLLSDGSVLSSPHATNHLDPSQLLSSPHLLGSFP